MQNYYPWNTRMLSQWLERELRVTKNVEVLGQYLNISSRSLKQWLQSTGFEVGVPITYEEVLAISQYRGWTVEKTTSWLEIKPAHWQILSKSSQA